MFVQLTAKKLQPCFVFFQFYAGLYDEAVNNADAAIRAIQACPPSQSQSATETLAKAYHRKAQGLMGSGQLIPSLKTYKAGLANCPGSNTLAAAARLALDNAPASWYATFWGTRVDAAQQPHPLSSRDGKLLKLAPRQFRLDVERLRIELRTVFEEPLLLEEAKDLVWKLWIERRYPGRSEVAFFRAAVYLQLGFEHLAEHDAVMAATYGPKDANGGSTWAAPLMILCESYECRGENLPALINAARAAEIDPARSDAADALERLLRRVPEHYAEAIRSGGVERLNAVLAAEKERDLPPFMRPKPKYYYYYEWMRRRIEASHPDLPEPIMDKLLTMDANELDLIMQYPAAIDGTVAALQGVLQEKGEEALSTCTVPLLSWEKKQELENEGQHAQQRIEGAGPQAKLLQDASQEEASDKFSAAESESGGDDIIDEVLDDEDRSSGAAQIFSLD